MKRVIEFSGLMLALLLGGFAQAQVVLQVSSSTPIPSSVTPGTTFSVAIQLNNGTSTGVAGCSVAVQTVNASNQTVAYNLVNLTGISVQSAALNDPTSAPTYPVALSPQAGTVAQPDDLGVSFTSQTLGQGTSNLEVFTFTVSPIAVNGTYSLEFYSMNGDAQAAPFLADANGNSVGTATAPLFSASFTVTGAGTQSFADWAQQNSVGTGPAGMPEYDGVTNAMKYICDIKPGVPMSSADRAALPTVGIDTSTATDYLMMTYRQNRLLTGMAVDVETSNDLQTWTAVQPPDVFKQVSTDSSNGDPIMEIGVKTNGLQKQFIRLDISQQ